MSNFTDARTRLLRLLADEATAKLKQLDAAGYFRPPAKAACPGMRLSVQGALYPLAALHETPHEANPYFDDEKILEAACSAGDALCAVVGRDGRLPAVFPGGAETKFSPTAGTTCDPLPPRRTAVVPWLHYHWLQTWMLLADELTEARTEAWRRGLEAACATLLESLPQAPPTPGAAWEAAFLSRAGAAFEADRYRDAAEEFMRRLAEAQDARTGSWRAWTEPGLFCGLHALALYFEFTRDVWVLPALERARAAALKRLPPKKAEAETNGREEFFCSALAPFAATPLEETPEGERAFAALLRDDDAIGRACDFLAAADCLLFYRAVAGRESQRLNAAKAPSSRASQRRKSRRA